MAEGTSALGPRCWFLIKARGPRTKGRSRRAESRGPEGGGHIGPWSSALGTGPSLVRIGQHQRGRESGRGRPRGGRGVLLLGALLAEAFLEALAPPRPLVALAHRDRLSFQKSRGKRGVKSPQPRRRARPDRPVIGGRRGGRAPRRQGSPA